MDLVKKKKAKQRDGGMTLLSHPKKGSPYVLACSVTVYSKWCHLEPGLTSIQFLGTN